MSAIGCPGLAAPFVKSWCVLLSAFIPPSFSEHSISLSWPVFLSLTLMAAAFGALLDHLFARSNRLNQQVESASVEMEMLKVAVDYLPDPIYVKDSQSRFLMANKAAALNMGAQSATELIGRTDFNFFPQELATEFFEDEKQVMNSREPMLSRQEKITDPDGHVRYVLSTKVPLFDVQGRAIGIVGVGRNITKLKAVEDELRQAREALEVKASHDSLTSLLNRGAIMEVLERELARGLREGTFTSVLLGDLDHFKNINDAYGHPVGDEVLCGVAGRLQKFVRTYDTVGRYGGEEFLIVLPGCTEQDALNRANQLREAVAAEPMHTSHGDLPITISIGVLAAQKLWQPGTLEILREVDTALYAAKAAGRNCCRLAIPIAAFQRN